MKGASFPAAERICGNSSAKWKPYLTMVCTGQQAKYTAVLCNDTASYPLCIPYEVA